MADYKPIQKLTIFNGILISEVKVAVGEGLNLFEMWNFTNSQPNVTNIAYRIIKDEKQTDDTVLKRNNIPWNGGFHTVEITIYTADSKNPTEHTSNNSDDADIPDKEVG